MFDVQTKYQNKNHSEDRTLVLKPIEGRNIKSTMGAVDPRLFTGGNNLRIIRDPATHLWGIRYDHGIVPQPLKQMFTSFNAAKNYANDYFKRRGLEVTEVLDNYA